VEADPKPSTEALTLLGNAYRQLGDLPKSEEVLKQALSDAGQDPFPLYGLGRTYLAQGKFDDAADFIRTALQNGGRKATRVEMALAMYYGDSAAEHILEECYKVSRQLKMEDYRVLMVNHLLYQLHQRPDHANPEQVNLAKGLIANNAKGLAYWEAEAKRFADSDYGKRLADDIKQMKEVVGNGKS
jgi:tetratricopeptide (TPR) repeat protein